MNGTGSNTGTLTAAETSVNPGETFNSGQVVFAGSPGALESEPGGTLTLGPAMVVRGKTGSLGAIASGVTKPINQGLIAADVAGCALTEVFSFQQLTTDY